MIVGYVVSQFIANITNVTSVRTKLQDSLDDDIYPVILWIMQCYFVERIWLLLRA